MIIAVIKACIEHEKDEIESPRDKKAVEREEKDFERLME